MFLTQIYVRYGIDWCTLERQSKRMNVRKNIGNDLRKKMCCRYADLISTWTKHLEPTVIISEVNQSHEITKNHCLSYWFMKIFVCLYLIVNTHSNSSFSHGGRNFPMVLLLHSALWMKLPQAYLIESGILNHLIKRILSASINPSEGCKHFR